MTEKITQLLLYDNYYIYPLFLYGDIATFEPTQRAYKSVRYSKSRSPPPAGLTSVPKTGNKIVHGLAVIEFGTQKDVTVERHHAERMWIGKTGIPSENFGYAGSPTIHRRAQSNLQTTAMIDHCFPIKKRLAPDLSCT